MILGSYKERKPGERVVGLVDADGNELHDQPFLVLRVATREEFIAANGEELGADGLRVAVDSPIRWTHFYEVSVD